MRHRTVEELMTTSVVRVREGTTFKEITRLLAEHHITAVPVVDDQDRPVGVVSETDLLRKEQEQLDPAGHVPAPHLPPDKRAKAAASTAAGLMTSPAVLARPHWSAVQTARMMDRHGIGRLPVVDDADRLVGMVSRRDLLRVFLRSDFAIRDEILCDVLYRTLGVAPFAVTAQVIEGRVVLSGTVERKSLIPVAVRLCESVDGVVEVSDRLGYRIDDTVGPMARSR